MKGTLRQMGYVRDGMEEQLQSFQVVGEEDGRRTNERDRSSYKGSTNTVQTVQID